MKKISQAIIGATLILDVAVVFTFGLAVISSFEDGSRLPETTFARKAAVGRVAGEMTSTCPATANMMIEMPAEGATITTSAFGIRAMANTGTAVPVSTAVYIVPAITSIPNIQASYIQTTSSWVADVSIATHQIQSGPFSFRAEGFDSMGRCIARSGNRHITINYTSTNNLLVPSISITSPAAGTLSGTKEIIGLLSNFSNTYSLPIKELQVWQGITWKKNFPLTRDIDRVIGNMDTTTLLDGDYTLKIHLVYNDGTSDKIIDSGLVGVTVSNANTSGSGTTTQTSPSATLSSPAAGTLSGTKEIIGSLSNFSNTYSLPIKELQVWQGVTWKKNFPLTRDGNNLVGSMNTAELTNGDYTLKIHLVYSNGATEVPLDSGPVSVIVSNANTAGSSTTTDSSTGTSGSTGSTSTDNTSTSGTGTSGSTGTTTPPPPPTDTTTATLTVAMTNPTLSTIPIILRSRDNQLAAKTSAAASGLQFKIHKAGEPADWFRTIDAAPSADKINWTGKLDLIDFKNGDYDITAVAKTGSGEVLSKPVLVTVQKLGLNWINPQTFQKLSGNVQIKTKIDGIYEKDGITPVKGIKVYFYQTNTQSPYTEYYNEQLYQSPGTQEWRLYDWTLKKEKLWKTNNSSSGKYRLIIKVVNESISTNNIWFPTEPIFIEINNQQTVSPSNNSNTSALGANNNQNLNTAATNTAASNSSNITVVGNANLANNTNTDSAQNTNAAIDSATAAVQSDSDQDGLSDEDERTRGTDPNSVDTDKDGLTDFEEIDKYGTDPLKNDTDGDGYMDGDEVQSLHDPLKPPTDPTAAVPAKPKPIEEPKASAKPILESLVVEKIENKPLPLPDNTNNPEPPPDENTIVLKGKGPANTILTLFIYSVDPLVITVKTDDDGNWEYELDKKLEDGEHELYVTVTDDTGKIQSQSNPIAFFVKEAKAVSPENYRADLAAREPVKTSSTDIYLIASVVLVLIAAIAGLAVALRRKSGI